MEVKTFTESGTLKICHGCGATVLVKKGVSECPICGSTDMEIDDIFEDDGGCSREDLARDWFYTPDIMPESTRRLNMEIMNIERGEKSVEPVSDSGHLAEIIPMFPVM